jgi:hypothetical protein
MTFFQRRFLRLPDMPDWRAMQRRLPFVNRLFYEKWKYAVDKKEDV